LDDIHLDWLLLRLDEYNIGGVNVKVLDDFAGRESLQIKIAAYLSEASTADGAITPSSPIPLVSPRAPTLPIPLLVWVDDQPENVEFEVQYAKDLGIHVLQLTSTGEAKLWIDQNLGKQSKEFY
jgi:hypothetical protein